MEKKYNREEYIKEYHLDIDEIVLLPLDIRLAYMDKLYKDRVEKAQEIKKEIFFKGYLHPIFIPYFEACGCQAMNYDFGIEEYGVKKVRKTDYKVDPKYVDMALEYTKEVAKIRSDVYESVFEGILERTKESLEEGVLERLPDLVGLDYILRTPLYNGLVSNEVSEAIAKRVIEALGIKHKETVTMSNHLSLLYRNVLNREGYELTNGKELMVRRLK